MEHIKSLALTICIVALLFGIIKSLLPADKYQKYMRLIVGLLFMILIINGVFNVVSSQELSWKTDTFLEVEGDVISQLETAVRNHINNSLNENQFTAKCTDVTISEQGEIYMVSDVFIDPGLDDKIKLTDFIKELTGIQEEQIHVE